MENKFATNHPGKGLVWWLMTNDKDKEMVNGLHCLKEEYDGDDDTINHEQWYWLKNIEW